MPATLLADFRARFVADGVNDGQPLTGRIVMNRDQLVLAGKSDRVRVPLSAVFDVAIGHVPTDVTEYFDDSVTVAWKTEDARCVAIVEAGRDAVDRFARVLFKARLNGTTAAVVHPATRGGRVLDTPATTATVALVPGGVAFRGDTAFTIDLATVTEFSREDRTIAGRRRPTAVVTHTQDGSAVETLVHVPDSRRFNVLGRYIRTELQDALAELEDVTITDEEVRLLVGLHAATGLADPGALLDDPDRADAVLASLREKSLVADDEGALVLTGTGRIVATQRLEVVND